jgi:hypothetical protein
MNSPIRTALFVCFFSTAVCTKNSLKSAEIDPRLQEALFQYFESLGNGIAKINSRHEKTLELLTILQLSQCELISELKAHTPRDSTRLSYLLDDLVDRKNRQIELSEKMIIERIAPEASLTDTDRELIHRLAVRIAATSMSVAEIKEKIIPRMFEHNTERFKRLDAIQDKVDLLDLELRRTMESICDRLAVLEEDYRRRMNSNNDLQVVQRPNLESFGQSVLVEQNRNNSNSSNNHQWRRINGTAWEPQGYATSEQLCSNPTLKWKNVYFDTNIKEHGIWRPHRHYGDIWIDCSGKILMVLAK